MYVRNFRKYQSPLDRIVARHPYSLREEVPTKAGRFLRHFDELIRRFPNLCVVLYLRRSAGGQDRSLQAQEKCLLEEMRKRGVRVLAIFQETGSGWIQHLEGRLKAGSYAQQHGAVLLAESAGRFMRSVWFKHDQKDPPLPTAKEWGRWLGFPEMQEVLIATWLDPDAEPSEVRSHETKRGLAERRRKKYAPGERKKEMERLLPKIRLLIRLGGKGREIASGINIPHRTVARWIEKARKAVPHLWFPV